MINLQTHHRSGLSTLAAVGLLALFAGVILGPGQMAYCVYFSGEEAGEYPFENNKSVAISLSPDMNPIRFNASIRHESPRRTITRKSSQFDATLSLGETEVWAETFRVSSGKTKKKDSGNALAGAFGNRMTTSATNIHSFDVSEAGDYQFMANQTRADLRVESMSLLVRSNVRQVNIPSAVAGRVRLVLGFVVVFIRLFRSSDKNLPTEETGMLAEM